MESVFPKEGGKGWAALWKHSADRRAENDMQVDDVNIIAISNMLRSD
jgi:hypothetical protein